MGLLKVRKETVTFLVRHLGSTGRDRWLYEPGRPASDSCACISTRGHDLNRPEVTLKAPPFLIRTCSRTSGTEHESRP